ncbi:hypothetical protein D3C72_1766560 [compost metagenome]
MNHFLDRCIQKVVGVDKRNIFHAFRKRFLCFIKNCNGLIDNVLRIGTCCLCNSHTNGRTSVCHTGSCVILRTKLNSCNIFQFQGLSVLSGFDDDIIKFWNLS